MGRLLCTERDVASFVDTQNSFIELLVCNGLDYVDNGMSMDV